LAVLDRTRQIELELVRSVFSDPRVTHDGTDYSGPPGLAAYYVGSATDDTPKGMIFCCPGDGKVSSIAFEKSGHVWSWNGNREKPTCKPSIQCTREGCRWHGWLTDGRFHL